MSRITFPLLLAALAIGGTAHAAGITLHSRKGSCQMTVPADWHVGKYGQYSADSPDGSMSALISSGPAGHGLAFAKQVMEGSFPPKQVFEDSPKRLFYRYGSDSKPGYYVGVPGNQGAVCGSQIGAPAGKEALVKQIAATVGATP
jgi:hypothetical protein